MLRHELKHGQVFKFTDCTGLPAKIVRERTDLELYNPQRLDESNSEVSQRMHHQVILWPPAKEEPNAAEALQPHWRALSPEPVSVIEAWGHHKNWYRGNAIKYLARAGSKKGVPARDDLLKALSFIIREITSLDGAPSWILGDKLGDKEQDANKQ